MDGLGVDWERVNLYGKMVGKVIDAGYEVEIYNQFWKIVIERVSRYDDGCGYPYINLYYRLGDEGYPKYIRSFCKLKNCIEYIKQHGIV